MASLLLLLLGCGSSLRHIQSPPPGPVSALPPYRARALYLAGAMAMERGEPQAAVDAFSAAVQLDPNSETLKQALQAAEQAADAK